jgi:hypothetical protein
MGLTLFIALRKGLRELVRELTDSYRPELHYMRGPGPKCREKRASPAPGGASAGME